MDLSAAKWVKSSYSGANNNCVEVAALPCAVAVRDSKDQSGPALVFTPGSWESFKTAVRAGEFDLR